MVDKAWKRHERNTARSLGTVRTPLSGKASRHTSSDVIHPSLYVECKYRRHLAVATWLDEATQHAKEERKTAILALRQSGRAGAIAVMSWDTFLKLLSHTEGNKT